MEGVNVTRRSKPLRLQSWIPPSFAWSTSDVFFIEVTLNDPDVVEFISTRVKEIPVSTQEAAQLFNRMAGERSLFGQLQEAVSPPAKLKSEPECTNLDIKISVFCHGVFLLPGEKR